MSVILQKIHHQKPQILQRFTAFTTLIPKEWSLCDKNLFSPQFLHSFPDKNSTQVTAMWILTSSDVTREFSLITLGSL